MNATPNPVREVWPHLNVASLAVSLAYYRDGLGFEVVNQAEHDGQVFWCRLKRGGACVMLEQRRDPAATPGGITLYFLCADADAVHAELVANGVETDDPLTAYYGMRQVELTDPDGYRLCFESVIEGDAD